MKDQMKARSTIRKQITLIQKEFSVKSGGDTGDLLASRIAYEVISALRWATEDVKGWSSVADNIKSAANLIRDEIRTARITARQPPSR